MVVTRGTVSVLKFDLNYGVDRNTVRSKYVYYFHKREEPT